MDEIVELLSSKLPLELVNKILYEYGGAQSPIAKLIKDNTVKIYTKPIDYGHAYYARYKGVNYCGGEHMTQIYEVDDIPIAECHSHTFEWGKSYEPKPRHMYRELYLTFIDEDHIYVHYPNPMQQPGGQELFSYTLYEFIDDECHDGVHRCVQSVGFRGSPPQSYINQGSRVKRRGWCGAMISQLTSGAPGTQVQDMVMS